MNELGQIVEKVLRRQKMWRGYKENLIIEDWHQAAGREIAAVSQARLIKNKILWIIVKDSTWSYHLSLLKPRLIKKVNEYAESTLIKDIHFQIGELNKKGNDTEKVNNNLIGQHKDDQVYLGEDKKAYIHEIKTLLSSK